MSSRNLFIPPKLANDGNPRKHQGTQFWFNKMEGLAAFAIPKRRGAFAKPTS